MSKTFQDCVFAEILKNEQHPKKKKIEGKSFFWFIQI